MVVVASDAAVVVVSPVSVLSDESSRVSSEYVNATASTMASPMPSRRPVRLVFWRRAAAWTASDRACFPCLWRSRFSVPTKAPG